MKFKKSKKDEKKKIMKGWEDIVKEFNAGEIRFELIPDERAVFLRAVAAEKASKIENFTLPA